MIWPLLAVAVALVVLLRVGRVVFRGSRPVSASFWCPFRERAVDVGFQITAWDARPVAVDRCSAFTPPTAVTCEKRCMERPEPAVRTRTRRFRCALQRRDVEVNFQERGLLWFGRPVEVISCTAFDQPSAIECRRPCLNAAFRRQWEPALPVRTSPALVVAGREVTGGTPSPAAAS
jgi:hypothetical protein